MRLALIQCEDAERFALATNSPLTEWERTVAKGIAHARRRGEWVSGRIAAKWLFLQSAARESSFAWPPAVHVVAPRELDAISPETYRRVEVRRNGDGAPYILCDGAAPGDGGAQVSIAHCGGWAVAALSGAGAVGVDMEEVGPRGRGFYEANMTDGERRWMIGAPECEADRVGTLLWVLKEAVLKTGASAARTIWEMSAIDIDVVTPSAHVAATWPSNGAGRAPTLLTLPVRVALRRAPRSSTYAAYGAIGNLAIGVVALTPSNLERTSAARWRADSGRIFQRIADLVPGGGFP